MAELIGSWNLVSCRRTTGADKRVDYPHGEHPQGTLLYTEDGRISVHLAAGGRPPLSSADLSALGDAEAARAFISYLGYSGRYEIDGDTVVHRVEVASIPNMAGTDLVRHMSLSANTLVLRAPTIETPDGPQDLELHWERMSLRPSLGRR